MALRFSRRNSSVLRCCASWADFTRESSSGNLNWLAWRTVTQKRPRVRLNTSTARSTRAATRCRLVRVVDFAPPNLLETRIICTLPSPRHASLAFPEHAYEKPLHLPESGRRSRRAHATGRAPDRASQDSLLAAAGVPGAI